MNGSGAPRSGGTRGENRPCIAVTMGDPAGIGPEVTAAAWNDAGLARRARLLVIGAPQVMAGAAALRAPQLKVRTVRAVGEARFAPGTMEVLAADLPDLTQLVPGQVQASAGAAAARSIETAVELALAGECAAICTAPINKASLRAAGLRYNGHTDMLADLTGSQTYAMVLAGPQFSVIHVTTHVALREACRQISRQRVIDVTRLGQQFMQRLGIQHPRIAVAGLNPHASEDGLFGSEEAAEIEPAVVELRARGLKVRGPVSPDAVFRQAADGAYHLVVAMYHDQGHIPMKLLAFAETVNVTAGLPIIRTSVDHGTAFDIAGQGTADETNMVAALNLAIRLAGAQPSPG